MCSVFIKGSHHIDIDPRYKIFNSFNIPDIPLVIDESEKKLDTISTKYKCGCFEKYFYTEPAEWDKCFYHKEQQIKNDLRYGSYQKQFGYYRCFFNKDVYDLDEDYKSVLLSGQTRIIKDDIKLSDIKFKHYKSLTNKILPFITTNNGYIFGGFVRDFIINKEMFNDIDIWFKTIEDADNFINNMKKEYNFIYNEFGFDFHYKNNAPSTYILHINDEKILFDIFVSNTLPVDDSPINMFLYPTENVLQYEHYYKNNNFEIYCENLIKLHLCPILNYDNSFTRLDRFLKLRERGWYIKL